MLFITVEAKTTNPDDALLLTLDSFDWSDAKAMEYWLSHNDEASLPDWQSFSEDQPTQYVFPIHKIELASGEETAVQIPNGVTWRYESLNTLVTNVMVDLRCIENLEETIHVTFYPLTARPNPNADLPENPAPTYTDFAIDERTTLTATVKTSSMENRFAVADVPFVYTDFEINRLEVLSTPLATYISINKRPLVPNGDLSAYFDICDANGVPYEDLAAIHAYTVAPNAGGSWDNILLDYIFAKRGDLPDSIILRAVSWSSDPNAAVLEDLVVNLTEVPQ